MYRLEVEAEKKGSPLKKRRMRQYILRRHDIDGLVNRVTKQYDFVAPVSGKKNAQVQASFFTRIDDPGLVFLDTKTHYTAKGFFFDTKETIFEFRDDRIIDPSLRLIPTVFFAMRRCDLNSIWHQDIVFLDVNPDPFYEARRNMSLLIGLHCVEGDQYCFCNSVQLKDFFDLMFYDKGEIYAVEVGSEKGQRFIDSFGSFFYEFDNVISEKDRETTNVKRLDTLDIQRVYNSKAWEKGAELCIACGACNFLCPNCHCFSIDDEVSFDVKRGRRTREPASCQLRHFTRVAGEHIFRDSKLARFKHRIYHQIQYFKERHGVVFCTGCGRCIEGCPARIDWVEMINEMTK